MPYYNNDDRPSSILKKTLIGVGAVAAVLGRKQLGKWGARAIETVSEALIHNKKGSAFTLTRNFDDIERVLSAKEFGVRTQYAEQRMKDALVSQRGWNAEAADKLFATTRNSNQWTKGVGFSADASVFSGRSYEGLLGSIGKDANTALSDIYAARSHAKVLTIKSGTAADLSKEGMGGLLNQLEITRNAVEQSFLKQMAENARAGTVKGIARGEGGYAQAFNKALGLSHVSVGDINRSPRQLAFKLGDEGFQRLQATASSMEALGRKHGVDVSSFQFGELLRDESGIIHDTRGASRLVNRGLGWLEQHTQIPMIPFREGFSPASLFSWLKSKDPKFAANITRQGLQKQIGISDLAEDGLSAIRVGRELIGTKYGANVADSEVTRVFEGRFAALDATGGFGKRSLTSLYASRNMDFSGQTGIKGWFNFENQMERSQLDKILQVINRSKNPEGELHATEAFRRMLEAPGDLSERGVDAITSLIYNRGRLLTSTLDNAAIKDDALRAVFDNLEDDKALLKFFDEAKVAGDYSPRLKDIIHEYQSTRGEFAHGYHPFSEESVLDLNFFGNPDPQRGIDVMRRKLQAEYIEKMKDAGVDGDQIIAQIRNSADLTKAQKLESEAVVRSHMSYDLPDGQFLDKVTMLDDGDPRSLEAIAATLRKHTSRLTVTNESINMDLPPSFIVREHASILGTINEAIKNNQNPIEAILQVGQSPAIQQYVGAFFQGVGNPKNYTQTSTTAYFMAERVNRMLTGMGVGLGAKDLGSAFDIWKGLGMKRVLPLFAGYEAYNQLNSGADDLGIPGLDEIGANVGARVHLAKAWLYGGVHASQVFPGSEKYFNNTSFEEEKERLRSGYEPIRANKFWLFGSRSEFAGGKIKYYLPDRFQRAHSDWETAENSTISGPGTQAHSWMPSVKYPLAPLAKILDPYWFESRFSEGPYAERPYVRSGPLFSPETPWGPALNSTIGAVVKPQVWLHPEYNPYTNSAEDIKANTYGKSGIRGIDDSGGDDPMEAALSSYDDEPRFVLNGGSIGSVKPAGGIQLMGAPQTSAGSSLSGGGGGGGAGGGGFRSGRSYAKAVLSAVNAKLKAHNETVMPIRLQDQYEPNIMGYNEDPNDVQTIGNARYMERSLQDLHGIYGWGAALALNRDIPFGVRMADSSMAYGIGERFWDSNLGGLGGEANEVFRRFLPKRARTVQYYNPVPNQYFNSWLPGDSSFINIQRGDPQSVFENGQMRLPSSSYEKLHGVKLMQTRASSIGGSIDDIVNGMLQAGEPMSQFGQNVTEAGNTIHRRIQDVWRKQGILKSSETEIYNEQLGISGHIDAYLNIRGQDVIGEIKSMSAKKFNSGNIFPEHLDQLNFYLHTTGIRKGVLAYVNRDDLSQSKIFNIDYDPIRQKLVELKVARARQIVAGKVEDGEISRAQLYDPTTRFEILSDLSPYSTEFQALSKFLSGSDQLSKAQEERFQAAKLRARNVKKRYSLYGYHFTHGADLSTNENFTVKQVIDPNTIQTTSGETIKLAGIRASEGRAKEYLDDHPGGINFSPMGIYEAITNKEYGSASEEIYARYGIRPGAHINVEYSEDPDDQNSQDMFRSLRGQVFVGSTSLNKALLANGIGEERETDWSAPGINVRFNEIERGIGSAWEHISHADSPFNTKLLRVRTPLEEYKRAQVYGTNSGDWAHPISSFIKPTVEAYASRHPVIAAASMGLFASMFGKTQSAKLMFASAGAVVGFGTSLSVKAQEFATGDSWIPDSVQKRRDIEEYYDKLKYVKFKRLYGYAVEQAMNEENTDVEEIISRNKEMGEIRKMAQQSMKKAKSGRRLAKAQADLINMRLKKITEFSGTLNLGPWATQALLYRDQYESTFYGYEKGAPYKNVMRAIPKYEREIVAGIIKDSTPREKQEFFDLLPEYEKPALAGQLGIKYTGRKQVIDDYFMNHTLPELNWQGWNPQINLTDLKSRTARAEGVDSFAMGIYPQEIERAQADTREINVPTVHGSTFAAEDLLIELLQSKGINPRNVNIQVYPDSSLERNQIEVEGNVSHSRTGDIVKAIRGYM